MIKRVFKIGFKWSVILIILAIISAFSCDYYIKNTTKSYIYNDVKKIPECKVGMVLGTSKYLKGGSINYYYSQRIKGTVDLYHAGKIKFILISGDNGNTNYNEPEMFKTDLIKNGIPADKIFLDYAGFRTLDSVMRAKHVFKQSQLIIISQKFHIERALYLAKNNGIEATGYAVGNYAYKRSYGLKIREKLARVKAIIDIIFKTQPKFYGKPISIQ